MRVLGAFRTQINANKKSYLLLTNFKGGTLLALHFKTESTVRRCVAFRTIWPNHFCDYRAVKFHVRFVLWRHQNVQIQSVGQKIRSRQYRAHISHFVLPVFNPVPISRVMDGKNFVSIRRFSGGDACIICSNGVFCRQQLSDKNGRCWRMHLHNPRQRPHQDSIFENRQVSNREARE